MVDKEDFVEEDFFVDEDDFDNEDDFDDVDDADDEDEFPDEVGFTDEEDFVVIDALEPRAAQVVDRSPVLLKPSAIRLDPLPIETSNLVVWL